MGQTKQNGTKNQPHVNGHDDFNLTHLNGYAKSMQVEIGQTNALYKDQVRRRAELQAELGAQRLTDDSIAEIIQYARDVREGIANANYEAKRRMLESLDVKVTVKDGRYYVKCVLGETEGEIRKIARRTKGAIVPVSLGRR